MDSTVFIGLNFHLKLIILYAPQEKAYPLFIVKAVVVVANL